MRISIPKFDKYNPRGDVKHPTWFRMQNQLFTDEDLFGAPALTKLLWVYLLCLRNEHGDGFKFNPQKAAMLLPAPDSDVIAGIAWLEAAEMIETATAGSGRVRTDTPVDVRARPHAAGSGRRARGRTGRDGTDGTGQDRTNKTDGTGETRACALIATPPTTEAPAAVAVVEFDPSPDDLTRVWHEERKGRMRPVGRIAPGGELWEAASRVCREMSLEQWRVHVQRLARSRFGRGEIGPGGKDWAPTMRWAMKVDTRSQCAVGQYDDEAPAARAGEAEFLKDLERVFAKEGP